MAITRYYSQLQLFAMSKRDEPLAQNLAHNRHVDSSAYAGYAIRPISTAAVLGLRSDFIGFETIFSGFHWFLSTDIKDQEIAVSRTNMSALVGHRVKMHFLP